MFSFLYVDSDLGYWYIIWKVNTKGGWIWETPFALICLCGLGFHGRPVAWVQVNRQRLEETVCMLPFHSCYIWGTWRSKEVRFNGGAKRGEQIGGLMLSYGGKGKATKRGTFMGSHKKRYLGSWPLNYSILNYRPISASCGVIIYMHYLHNCFFINLQMTTEWGFAFLNTALKIFCLMYCLHIQFRFRRHRNDHRKMILTFFFVWFYHCHNRRNYILHSLFIVLRPWS